MGQKINQIKGGVILSYLSLFVGNAISIVYTPIMIRMLGQSEYGLYNLVASFVSYLGLFSFGFDNTYLRYYTQYKETESEDKVASLNGMFLIGVETIFRSDFWLKFNCSGIEYSENTDVIACDKYCYYISF